MLACVSCTEAHPCFPSYSWATQEAMYVYQDCWMWLICQKKKKVKVRTDLPGSMAQLLLFWTQLLESNNNELHGLAWRCPWPCWAWVNRMLDYLVKKWCWASSHLCCACTWLSGTVLTPQVLPLFAFCFLSHTPYSASVPRSWAKQNQGLLFILSCPLLFLCLFLLFSLLGECVLGIEPRTFMHTRQVLYY